MNHDAARKIDELLSPCFKGYISGETGPAYSQIVEAMQKAMRWAYMDAACIASKEVDELKIYLKIEKRAE